MAQLQTPRCGPVLGGFGRADSPASLIQKKDRYGCNVLMLLILIKFGIGSKINEQMKEVHSWDGDLVNQKDKDGKSVLDYANASKKQELSDCIQQLLASPQ